MCLFLLGRGRRTAGGRETHENLEVILYKILATSRPQEFRGQAETYINHPLQTGQCTNHHDTHGETVPKSTKPNFLVDAAHDSSKCFAGLSIGIELADHDIGGVGDNGAENTSEITTCEGNTGLGSLAVVALLSRKAVVNLFDDGLKGRKLHHCIWNLTSPQRIQSLVKATPTLFAGNGADAVERARIRIGNRALHSHLDCFKGAESNVGKEFSRGRGSQVETSLVLVCGVWSGNVAVRLFEVFIPTILESSLDTVSKERWAPTRHNSAKSFSAVNLAPCLEVARVELGIDLSTGLDEIEGRDGSMSEALPIDGV